MKTLVTLYTVITLLGASNIPADIKVSGENQVIPNEVIVDRIEGNYAVCEIELGRTTDIPLDKLNIDIEEGSIIDTKTVAGYISGTMTDLNSGNTLYQFKSYDDTVWWCLTEKEIGFTPIIDSEYILCYYDNGTTKINKPCDCLEVYDCECEVYDDIFIALWESRV